MFKKIKKFFKVKKNFKLLLDEYEIFEASGITNKESYVRLRNLFVDTKSEINDLLSDRINEKIGKYNLGSPQGLLGTEVNFADKVSKLKKDGYVIFENILDENVLNDIYEYALNTPVSYLKTESDNQDYSEEKVFFDENNIISSRYQFTGNEILKSSVLQKIIFDQSLLNFAQEYLGCKPILDLVAFWWSAPFGGKGKSAAAQMYHFDLDRIKFMKFFFYITDVDSETGPHCYVRSSHNKLAKEINRDGRFEDSEIERIFGKNNMLELCGKRGTIMAVDTRGFHKGKELIKGKRLLFQIQFTNSLFGQTYDVINYDLIENEYKKNLEEYYYTYNHIS